MFKHVGLPGGSAVKIHLKCRRRVLSLGGEDPLEEGMASHSSILAWRIPMDRGTWCATVHGVAVSPTRLNHQAKGVPPVPGESSQPPGDSHPEASVPESRAGPIRLVETLDKWLSRKNKRVL